MSSYWLLNIISPVKATLWNVSVDRGNNSLNAIIDTGASKSLMFTLKVHLRNCGLRETFHFYKEAFFTFL